MATAERLAVFGDLHWMDENRADHLLAREQTLFHRPSRLVSLGDLGGYGHCGTAKSFAEGSDFFGSFGVPWRTLAGNHDLEGTDFPSDDENRVAWLRHFGYDKPWHAEVVAGVLLVHLSGLWHRDNPECNHEVRLGPEQFAWLQATLADHAAIPTAVFAHVPVLGSGLLALVHPHGMAPNAHLDTSDGPEKYAALLDENPQVKLWFSAHNHLGQNRLDAISRLGECHFIHVATTSGFTRDGERQSRLVDLSAEGAAIHTLDHVSGELHLDLSLDFRHGAATRFLPARLASDAKLFLAPRLVEQGRIGASAFVRERKHLLEYDARLGDLVGVVADEVESFRVRGDRLEIVDVRGAEHSVGPGRAGRFRKIWHPNPYLAKKRNAS